MKVYVYMHIDMSVCIYLQERKKGRKEGWKKGRNEERNEGRKGTQAKPIIDISA